ncbi:hypothetical protein CC80DRAFT_564292 [Byssothecium circinans]|uniref:Uncharacterized protein n=1 Tax=Byssothecium circinans TaxID=147558 RepID=A0A6A5TY02_9PLEO|nr:hypothetical protein CC80DRAFT_564292 [Byssothecium circinans]
MVSLSSRNQAALARSDDEAGTQLYSTTETCWKYKKTSQQPKPAEALSLTVAARAGFHGMDGSDQDGSGTHMRGQRPRTESRDDEDGRALGARQSSMTFVSRALLPDCILTNIRLDEDAEVADDQSETKSTEPHHGTFLPLHPAEIRVEANKARLPTTDYLFRAKRSLFSLIDGIYDQEVLDGGKGTEANDHVSWRTSLWGLFASIPESILYSSIDGTLPKRHLFHRDPAICKYYEPDDDKEEHDQHEWLLQRENPKAPAIYNRYYVDDEGNAPSPAEYMQIVEALHQYVSGENFEQAYEIDGVFHKQKTTMEQLRKHGHGHLEGKEIRLRVVHIWCAAIEKMCNVIPQDRWTKPCPVPSTYTGYTIMMSERPDQYTRKISTSWLCLLIEATFKVVLPNATYQFHLYTVCWLASPSEVERAEQAITRCSNSSIVYGGFNIVSTGQCSSSKMANFHPDEREEAWAQLMAWRLEHTAYRENAAKEAWRYDGGIPTIDELEAEYLQTLQDLDNFTEEMKKLETKAKEEFKNVLKDIHAVDVSDFLALLEAIE